MKALLSWLREFVDVPGTAESIGAKMSLRGLALEGVESHGPGNDDAVLDFDVTANRPDCLSIRGIAREIATAYGLPLRVQSNRDLGSAELRGPASAFAEASADRRSFSGGWSAGPSSLPIRIDEPDLCRRYAGAIADVRIGPSPSWMQERLLACGVRPISNVVDITNYVLLELGQPMHAFDLARLAGPAIVVRRARAGEPLTTLDGKKRVLDTDMLVIADADRASAVAGVMGGADSEVSAGTQQIVFESAWFKPPSVRATSKRLGLRTEASYRFERGNDLTLCVEAMERALALLEATGAGRRRGGIVDCYPTPYTPRHVHVTPGGIERLLGMRVPDDDAERILQSLGFGVRRLGGWQTEVPDARASVGSTGASWQVEVPGWRVDIAREVDVIEEAGRHHGFEHLPTTFPAVEAPPLPSDPRIARDGRVRRALLGMGLSEAITFGFIDTAGADAFRAADEPPVLLANPLSEKFTTLRPSLLPGLVDAVSHNRRHGRRDVRLFEIGTRFSQRGESRGAAVAWTGLATPDHWSGGRRDVDFFDVKGVVEQVCGLMRVVPRIQPASVSYLVEGRAAEVVIGDERLGVVGQLDPEIAERREIPSGDAVYVLELDLDRVTHAEPKTTRVAQPLPRHPSVVRDVSILVDDTLSAETVRGTIRAASAASLVDVREFDRYQGKGVPDGKVSLSYRLTFQAPDRTLTDGEVQQAMDAIVRSLVQDLDAVQR
jgi:phenylalanyl-tRNA synthetase beta chain